MDIRHEETDGAGKFFIEEGGNQMALMTYRLRHQVMIIDHTEVDEDLQGQHIGQRLVTTAADYARGHQLKIKPVCSFARAVFDKTPELQDVLD